MAPQDRITTVDVIDIRREELGFSLLDDIHKRLRLKTSEKTLPTLLLYDEKGLNLFEDITFLDEYYLTNAEIEVLTKHAVSIAQRIQDGSLIIELGSGNLRKIKILLAALEKAGKQVDYYALDVSLKELERTFSALPEGSFRYVRYHALLGTYEDGLAWLKQPENRRRPCCILSMGSSIGNFDRDEAGAFLSDYAQILRPHDLILIGLDACQNETKVYHAYNDREGKTHEFYGNGLVHANKLFGKEVFKAEDWNIVGRYNTVKQCHQAFYAAKNNLIVDNVEIKAGEEIRIEESHKYSHSQSCKLWQSAGLVLQAQFGNSHDDYYINILSLPAMAFPLKPEQYAPKAVPSLVEYEQLWSSWDTVTLHMLPHDQIMSKPIKLRNCCLFYLGHIPTFLDIHMARATSGPPTEPSFYWQIFERGIDPDVDNPEQCHAHSETPEEWPTVEQILEYQDRVRNRVRSIYSKDIAATNRKIGRALWLAFEHEALHLETLLYMLVQSDKIFAPPGTLPDFKALAQQAQKNAVANQWFDIPSSTVLIGMADVKDDNGHDHYFGWDNEKPQRQARVRAFQAKARPITNREYAQYLEEDHRQTIPASWASADEVHEHGPIGSNGVSGSNSNGVNLNGHSSNVEDDRLNSKSVRTVYGLVPLKYALDWPVLASFDELSGCAKWMGGRIPTTEEAHSIYNYVDGLKSKEAERVQVQTISAVNGHLSNDGVEESPPSKPPHDGASSTDTTPNPRQLFADLTGCNVGFQHFHPMPVTQKGDTLLGRSDLGGVWEWTSSVLEEHEGFEPMDLYPAYTADFFDGKHNIILGGSWATHPRIAGRKSFVNWYQRNYLFAWAGARVVRDL